MAQRCIGRTADVTKPATHFSLDDEVIRSCRNRCVSTACRLIDTVYDNLGTLYRSSGWHAVYCECYILLLLRNVCELLMSSSKSPSRQPLYSWQHGESTILGTDRISMTRRLRGFVVCQSSTTTRIRSILQSRPSRF